MKLYASSVIRNGHERAEGAIALIDWDTGQVENSVDRVVPQPWCRRNPNPRGGTRGWRGLTFDQHGRLVAANYDTLVWFSPDLCVVDQVVTHPSLGNLHTLGRDGSDLVMASTANECIARYDGRRVTVMPLVEFFDVESVVGEWYPALERRPAEFDPACDYRDSWREDSLHVNAVARLADGSLVALCNRIDMVLMLEPCVQVLWARDPAAQTRLKQAGRDEEIPVDIGGLSAPHDIVPGPGGIYLNSSANRRLCRWAPDTGLVEIWSAESTSYRWLRGLDVRDNRAFVGTGDGQVVEIDLTSGHEVRVVQVFPAPLNGAAHSVFSVLIAP